MVISKIEAAQRQLDTAIELYLHEYDLLSVHTLAWAAFSILVSYDKATNAGGVWAKHIRDNPSDGTRKLANFLKHADRDSLEQLGDLTDEYAQHLLLEGCKLYYELADARTRPIDVFYCYDIYLDGDAQDRELDREDRSREVPTAEEMAEEERLNFENKKKLLGVARHFLTAEKSAWSECPPRDYNIGIHFPSATWKKLKKLLLRVGQNGQKNYDDSPLNSAPHRHQSPSRSAGFGPRMPGLRERPVSRSMRARNRSPPSGGRPMLSAARRRSNRSASGSQERRSAKSAKRSLIGASAVIPSALPRRWARVLAHRQSFARATSRARTGLSET
jgi:hypothetical protein